MTPDKKRSRKPKTGSNRRNAKCAENAAEIAKLQAEIAQLSSRIKKLEHENRKFERSIPNEEEHLRELLRTPPRATKKSAAAL